MNSIIRQIKPWARYVLSAFRPERDIRVVSLGELFPNAPRIELLPPKTIETPELANATCVPGVAEYEAPTYTCPAVEAVELRDVLFCPVNNVVLTEDGRILAETITTIRRPEYLDDYALSARRVTPLSGTYSALRSRFNHYYHHLIDHASRLYFLGDPALSAFESIGLLLRDGPTPFEHYLLDHLKPPRVEPTSLVQRTLYRIEQFVLITPMTRRHAGYQRQPYLDAFENACCPSRPSRQSERIYIGRRPSGSKGRKVLNEGDVLGALEPLGFERYFLEDLSFETQCQLFYDADAVVAPHGAGLSNLIYSKDAKVVEYFPSHHLVPSFYFLAKSKGLTYRRLHADQEWRDDNFEMDVELLLDTLSELGIGR